MYPMSESPLPDNTPPASKRGLPINLMVIAGVALLIGAGLAFLVLSSNNAANNGMIAIPTSSRTLVREGMPAPQVALNTLDGKPVSLAGLKGKAVLVNFWASWCPPCMEETPALIEAYNELKKGNPNVEFVGIGTSDDKANLAKFAANNKIPYLVLDDADSKVSDAYAVRGMPTTFFIDSAGIVRSVWNGEIKKDKVLELMRGLN
jgi:cytochrome c biogenesis protein CcmG/thiol:disulfide interchange protein DsbE